MTRTQPSIRSARSTGARAVLALAVLVGGGVALARAGEQAQHEQSTLVARVEVPDRYSSAVELKDLETSLHDDLPWADGAIATSPDARRLAEQAVELAADRHERACAVAQEDVWLPWLTDRVAARCAEPVLAEQRRDTQANVVAAMYGAARAVCHNSPEVRHSLAGVLALSTAWASDAEEAYTELRPAAHRLEDTLARAYASHRGSESAGPSCL